jgi:hypothetical protein
MSSIKICSRDVTLQIFESREISLVRLETNHMTESQELMSFYVLPHGHWICAEKLLVIRSYQGN